MIYVCHVCELPVEPSEDGRVRVEGVTEQVPTGKGPWVWGPVVVHEECRLALKTPYDDRLGAGFLAAWENMTA